MPPSERSATISQTWRVAGVGRGVPGWRKRFGDRRSIEPSPLLLTCRVPPRTCLFRTRVIPAARTLTYRSLAGRWYLIDFARSRHTNPARIPVIPSGRWYSAPASVLRSFEQRINASPERRRPSCEDQQGDRPPARTECYRISLPAGWETNRFVAMGFPAPRHSRSPHCL